MSWLSNLIRIKERGTAIDYFKYNYHSTESQANEE